MDGGGSVEEAQSLLFSNYCSSLPNPLWPLSTSPKLLFLAKR